MTFPKNGRSSLPPRGSQGRVLRSGRRHRASAPRRRERKLADLSALRRELEALIEQCGHGTIAECRIVAALAPGDIL
jgi:hypothetical protein